MKPQRPVVEFHIFVTSPDDLNSQHHKACEVNPNISSFRQPIHLIMNLDRYKHLNEATKPRLERSGSARMQTFFFFFFKTNHKCRFMGR